MAGFSIILHPTDLSEDSMAAFRVACGLAREGTPHHRPARHGEGPRRLQGLPGDAQ